MLRSAPIPLALAALLAAAPGKAADTHVNAPSGGGLPPLDVKVDLVSATVDANGQKTHIQLDRAQLPAEHDVVVESIAIKGGRHLVHVKVPAKDADASGPAWEALFAAGRTPIFAGVTGFTEGDPGERRGKAIQVVEYDGTNDVLVGDIREDLHICGQDFTLLDPSAVYSDSLDLRGPVTAQRLTSVQQTEAQKITAVATGAQGQVPLAKLLVARGSSVPGSRGAELTDGDVQTVWSEKRPRVGQGEFVVMAAPRDIPIAKMQIVVAPPSPDKHGAAPKSFYLVTNAETFEVTLPTDAWVKPGPAYEIVFPKAIEASCLTIVLDSAYDRGLAHPEVGIAELYAYSEFDVPGATLDDVAQKLSSERGIAAAEVLKRAGPAALAAAERAYDGLDPRGRALAIDVAASHERCEEAAPLLARGLCDRGGQAPRKAGEKLQRCSGAAPVLAKKLREDTASRACVASTLAAIAPAESLEPIADAVAATGEEDRGTRAALRGSLAMALKSSPEGKLAALLGDTRRSASARLEMMRAAEGRVVEALAASEATIKELSAGSPPMRTRYLVLGPLGELGRAGDRAAATRIADAMARDPDWPVRARAAELAAGVPDVSPSLVNASRDAEPRVREAALLSLSAAATQPGAVDAARAALASDRWSFVKTQAVAVLAKAAPSGDVDSALGGVLRDPSWVVRKAAVDALGVRHASSWRDAVRERMDDEGEAVEVRAAAARALGGVCDVRSLERLTELAHKLATPVTSEEELPIAQGALQGLAALGPADLRQRLAPLLGPNAPPHVRDAAQRALGTHGGCR